MAFGSCGSDSGNDSVGDVCGEELAELYNWALVRPRPKFTIMIETHKG